MSRTIVGRGFRTYLLPLINICICVADQIGGPFAVIPETVEPCPEGSTDVPFILHLRVVKDIHNPPESFVFANHTSNFVLDDDKEATLKFAAWSKNGWKENFLEMKFKKTCTSLKKYVPRIWNEILSKISGPSADCPMSEGSYYLHNISTAVFKPENVPFMFYGRWRVDGKIIDPRLKKTVACTRFFARTVRKRGP